MQTNDLLLARLTMMLAASGMTEDEIFAVIYKLRSTSDSEVFEQVRLHRRSMTSTSKGMVRQIDSPVIRDNLYDYEALETVERLLILEAGLPKIAAAELLTLALKKRRPKANIPPFNSKDGFARWLQQLVSHVSLSELLHVAATLRNDRVHNPHDDDWIKGGKR